MSRTESNLWFGATVINNLRRKIVAKETVRIILTEAKTIGGKDRKQGYVLLEGKCLGKITAESLDKAIKLNQVKVVAMKDEEAS